jgi:phosphinothricin tripeptide acetyl hydrolase
MVAIVEMVRAMGINDPAKTIDERRALISVEGVPPQGASVEAVDAGGVPGELIVADGARSDRAVLHLHGGAYVAGGLGSHRGFAAALSAVAGAAVLLVDYRLAPEAPFPAAIDDAAAAYQWLIGPGGFRPGDVVVSGDSAGGGLASALLPVHRDTGVGLPAGAVLLSPWADLMHTGASHRTEADLDPMCSTAMLEQAAAAYVAGAVPLEDPRVSPIHADLAGLPPLLVHVGEHEVLRDDARVLAERASAAGTPVELHIGPGMIHVWHLFAGMAPESTRDLQVVGDWIHRQLGPGLTRER